MFRTTVAEKNKTHILWGVFENGSVCEVMWKNIRGGADKVGLKTYQHHLVVEPGRPHMTIYCMRIACWISKSTNTHSDYVIHIAFPLQAWLREHSTMLHFTYIASLAESDFARQKVKVLCNRNFSSYFFCASDPFFF